MGDTQVSIADAYSDETIGELRGWREQNERFNFDLWPSEDVRLDYALAKQPVIESSEIYYFLFGELKKTLSGEPSFVALSSTGFTETILSGFLHADFGTL